jgi:hypothetical protein
LVLKLIIEFRWEITPPKKEKVVKEIFGICSHRKVIPSQGITIQVGGHIFSFLDLEDIIRLSSEPLFKRFAEKCLRYHEREVLVVFSI